MNKYANSLDDTQSADLYNRVCNARDSEYSGTQKLKLVNSLEETIS